ncbi:MAG: hypothetical protein U9N78_04445 [Actinomycetota bacterium]|nr:hypothetical protein [Actinomycetota bacterium]
MVAGGPDVAFALYVSGDGGSTWHRVSPDDPVFDNGDAGVIDVVLFDGRVVVVGSAIWIGTWDE